MIQVMYFFLFSDDVCMIMKFLSNSPICHMTANTFPQLPNPSVVTLTANQHFAVNRWNTNYSGMKQKQNFDNILLHFFFWVFFSCTVFTFSTQKGYWMLFYRLIMFRKSFLFTILSKYLNWNSTCQYWCVKLNMSNFNIKVEQKGISQDY
jgi:hypothetical protein